MAFQSLQDVVNTFTDEKELLSFAGRSLLLNHPVIQDRLQEISIQNCVAFGSNEVDLNSFQDFPLLDPTDPQLIPADVVLGNPSQSEPVPATVLIAHTIPDSIPTLSHVMDVEPCEPGP